MRKRPMFPLALAIVLTLAFQGCASGGSGGGDGGRESLYREDIGSVLFEPFAEARFKMWGKHNIPLLREEISRRNVFWESSWIVRTPSLSESAIGARNRVVIRGYQTGENLDGTGVYRMTFTVENQIRTDFAPDWHPAPFPEEVSETYRRLYGDLMMEVRAGVRR